MRFTLCSSVTPVVEDFLDPRPRTQTLVNTLEFP